MSLLPKSEYICKKGLYPHCKGCDRNTYGWDYSGDFDFEKEVYTYHKPYNDDRPDGNEEAGLKIAREFGHEDLKTLSKKCNEILELYITKFHKMFSGLPAVKVILKGYGQPKIYIKESGITMTFEVEPMGFRHDLYDNYQLNFVVAYYQDVPNGEFKLVAQHNHPPT